MTPLNLRLGIISDPHIALPHTIWQNSNRFHLVEVSVAAFEQAIAHLLTQNIDVLLLPGDLTQHGEHPNHQWLQQRLAALPCPVYVVPGNHDVLHPTANETALGLAEFPQQYAAFGYGDPQHPWYHQELQPGIHLIGLNSNQFDPDGTQQGYVDEVQLTWLAKTLEEFRDSASADLSVRLVIVMIHHNTVEHLPDQFTHRLGRRYIVDNAPQVRQILREGGVKLVLTGHLHVQDLAQQDGLWEIATGSLVSYPHPYRVVELTQDGRGQVNIDVQSFNITQLPNYPDLLAVSREWLGDRSFSFMKRLAQLPPLNLPDEPASQLATQLRYFWADIAEGDRTFSFPDEPAPIRDWLERFTAAEAIDNQAQLRL